MRKNEFTVRGVLLGGACVIAIVGVTFVRLSEAQGRQAQVAAATQPAASVPVAGVPAEIRRALAGTCDGYNLELENAASIALRTGNQSEATRLMGLRQSCNGPSASTVASAK